MAMIVFCVSRSLRHDVILLIRRDFFLSNDRGGLSNFLDFYRTGINA